MATDINHNFVQQFNSVYELVTQQMGSKLRFAVNETRVTGDQLKIERLNNPNDVLKAVTARHASSVFSDMEHSRRVISLLPYVDNFMIDEEDKVRMLIDPTSDYIMEAAGQANRTIDDTIINALLGTAYAGATGTTSVVLPATQGIAAGGTGLTLAKVKQARKILMKANVDLDRDPLYLVAPAEGIEDLLNDAGLTSRDYVENRPNETGTILKVAGCQVVFCERLSLYAGTGYSGSQAVSSTSRPAILFTRSALKLALNQEIKTDIMKDPTHNMNYAVNIKMGIGAGRIHDDRVVDIRFAE